MKVELEQVHAIIGQKNLSLHDFILNMGCECLEIYIEYKPTATGKKYPLEGLPKQFAKDLDANFFGTAVLAGSHSQGA